MFGPFKKIMTKFKFEEALGIAYDDGFLAGCKAALVDPKTVSMIIDSMGEDASKLRKQILEEKERRSDVQRAPEA